MSETLLPDSFFSLSAIVEGGKVVNDARGAVLQLVNFDNSPIAMDSQGKYVGNVVSDMQIMVANAILQGQLQNAPELQTGVNSINQVIIDWAMNGSIYTPAYRCNGDSMHHGKLEMCGTEIYIVLACF